MRLISFSLCAALAATVCPGQTPAPKAPAAAAPAAAAPKPRPSPTVGARPVPRVNPKLKNPALANEKAPEMYKAKFTTTKGDFVVSVNRSSAPIGADRFYNLVKIGFFDGAYFFRVVPKFVVQFGIHSDPAISAAWRGANLQDDPIRETNKRGSLSFATAGPGTRTTQLFINFEDNNRLDSMGFSAFGNVTEGMDVVDKINPEYEQTADQGRIQSEGGAYLSKTFPRMDKIVSAVITEPAAAPPKPAPPKPAAAAAPKPPAVAPVKK
jgi:peptidyl-prolyl cis-trans isomerase A (cyclophilin A)